MTQITPQTASGLQSAAPQDAPGHPDPALLAELRALTLRAYEGAGLPVPDDLDERVIIYQAGGELPFGTHRFPEDYEAAVTLRAGSFEAGWEVLGRTEILDPEEVGAHLEAHGVQFLSPRVEIPGGFRCSVFEHRGQLAACQPVGWAPLTGRATLEFSRKPVPRD